MRPLLCEANSHAAAFSASAIRTGLPVDGELRVARVLGGGGAVPEHTLVPGHREPALVPVYAKSGCARHEVVDDRRDFVAAVQDMPVRVAVGADDAAAAEA